MLYPPTNSPILIFSTFAQPLKVSQITMRPARAKALIINAFALTGRIGICDTFTTGRCPGLCASAPSVRAALTFDTPSSYRLSYTLFENKKRRNPNLLELRLVIVELAILLHFNCLCHCSLFLLDLATESDVGYRSSDEDRRQCTEDYTEQHSE